MEEKVDKKIYIIELCKQEYAKQVLNDEKNYWVTAMMPCRVGICDENDGVYLYSMNMKLLTNFLSSDIKKIFKKMESTYTKKKSDRRTPMPHLHIEIMTKLFKIQGFFAKNMSQTSAKCSAMFLIKTKTQIKTKINH